MAIKELEVRIERLNTMRAAYSCSFGANPEEDSIQKLVEWAKTKDLIDKKSGLRLFGRNTFPTDKPSPHGYEAYLTLDGCSPKSCLDIETSEIPKGLYAVLRFKSLENITFAWKKLWDWIEKSGHEHIGWLKGKNGWVGGFEEQVNWQEQKPPTEWIFDLWVQLKD